MITVARSKTTYKVLYLQKPLTKLFVCIQKTCREDKIRNIIISKMNF